MLYVNTAFIYVDLLQGPPAGPFYKRSNAPTSIRGTIRNSFHNSQAFSDQFWDPSILLFNDYE